LRPIYNIDYPIEHVAGCEDDHTMTAPSAAQRSAKRPAARKVPSVDRILDVAIALFSRNGFEGTSTTEIGLGAGVAQSVVLYHYSSKDELWRAAMDRLFERVHAEFRRDRNVLQDLSSIDRLKVWIRQLVFTSAAHPELGRVVMSEGAAGGPRLKWLISRHLGADYELYEMHFRRAMEEGAIRKYPTLPLTILVHAAASMLFNLNSLVEAVYGRSPFDDEVIADQADMVVDVIFSGLMNRPQPAKEILS
jgi:TetR/AcrR family transcriptional regulator